MLERQTHQVFPSHLVPHVEDEPKSCGLVRLCRRLFPVLRKDPMLLLGAGNPGDEVGYPTQGRWERMCDYYLLLVVLVFRSPGRTLHSPSGDEPPGFGSGLSLDVGAWWERGAAKRLSVDAGH